MSSHGQWSVQCREAYRNLIFGKIKKVKSLSRVWLFVIPWTVAYQAPPSMGFSRQVYWSGLPFPSPGDLPHPGIEPLSPTFRADALTSEPPGILLIIATKWEVTPPDFLEWNSALRFGADGFASYLNFYTNISGGNGTEFHQMATKYYRQERFRNKIISWATKRTRG